MSVAYREPWTNGAYAYPQADTLAALWQGVARKRKPLTVHVRHEGLAGLIHCCDLAHAEDVASLGGILLDANFNLMARTPFQKTTGYYAPVERDSDA